MAMLQHDLRRLLSFHAVSQVGYMLLGIGTGTVIGVMGGVFHMVNHAIYKACLFLGAGSVERETGTQELGRLGGLGRTMPVTFACMFVAALAISGIPPLNGFVSKWLVYQACVAVDQPIFLIAALFGSVLTLASFVKVLHSVFWGPRPSALDGAAEGSGGIGMPIAMVTLAALCVLLGVFAAVPLDAWPSARWRVSTPRAPSRARPRSTAPRATLAAVGAARVPAHGPEGSHGAVFAPLAVTMLLLVGVLAALLVAFTGQMRARRVRGVFVGGQVLDRDVNRFPGTEFYKTIAELPGLGKALEVGERGTLDLYRVGGRSGRPPIRLPPAPALGSRHDLRGVVPGRPGRPLRRADAREVTMDPVLFVLTVFLLLGSLVALEMKDLLSAVIAIGVVGLGPLDRLPAARRARHRDHAGRGGGDRGDGPDPRDEGQPRSRRAAADAVSSSWAWARSPCSSRRGLHDPGLRRAPGLRIRAHRGAPRSTCGTDRS